MLDKLEIKNIVSAQIADAASYIDSSVAGARKTATEYYRGDKFGDEEEGRSQAVSRDVHDTVNAMLPSLMRIFMGGDSVVEFLPQSEREVEAAKQATDYVNYIFTRDNPGFEILFSAFKDALIRKCGVVKWWWDESEETRTAEYSGLGPEQMALLMEDLKAAQEAELIKSEEGEDGLEITVRLTKRKDRVIIACLPPEEFLIDRNAKDIDSAAFVAHRTMKTVSELVAMGYDEDDVTAQSEDADELRSSPDRLGRNPYSQTYGPMQANPDPTSRLVLYVESYMYIDRDEDGIAELVRVCTIGPGYEVVDVEEVESRNFAAFQCDPEPHTFFGYSVADKVMDIQRMKSALLRAALDSLSLSINPRVVVSSKLGGPNALADAMNTEIGAVIRADNPEAVHFIEAPDVSGSAFEAMGYLDQVKEARTGMSRVSLGLDPQALQNTSATAAAGQFTQSQQHIELVARIFAETGMKRLFRGILKLVSENQRQERMVNLRGQWVPVDPRSWKADMDVTTNVALGGGTQGEKIALLTMVKGTQEQIMLTAGPNNPLVTPVEYHKTLSELLQLGGFKNPDAFFKDPTPDPNALPPQPTTPPEDPKVIEAKSKAQLAQQQHEHQASLDQAKALSDHQLGELRIQSEARIQAQHNAEILALKTYQVNQELELKRQTVAAEIALKQQQTAAQIATHQQVTDSKLSQVEPGGEPG